MKTLTYLAILVFVIAVNTTNAQSFITAFETDYSGEITNDADGNLYLNGNFTGTKDFDPGSGVFNLTADGGAIGSSFVVKLNPEGEFLWAIKYVRNTFFGVTPSGSIFLAGVFSGTVDFNPGSGTTNLTSSGGDDIFVVRLNTNGGFIQAKKLGGATSEKLSGMAVSASGNMKLVGEFFGPTDFDLSEETYILFPAPGGSRFNLTLNSSLNYQSVEVFTIPALYINIEPEGITTPANANIGQVLVNGSGETYITGSKDAYLEPYVSLNEVFVQKIGDYSYTYESWSRPRILGSALDGEGNLLIVGGYDFTFNGFACCSGGFIIKRNSAGSIWEININDLVYDEASGIATDVAVDADGYIYVAGYRSDPYDFDPGSGTATVTGGFLLKLNSDGEFQWVESVPEEYKRISLDNNGAIWVHGDLTGTRDFDPGPETYNLTPSSSSSGFCVKLDIPNCASSPYSVHDPIWQQVIEDDPFCCGTSWDGACQDQYYDILLPTCAESPYNLDDPNYLDVIENDSYCCETSWDIICQEAYEYNLSECADSPFDADDPIYQQVIYEDPYCCNTAWDSFCSNTYQIISLGTNIAGSVTWNSACGVRAGSVKLYNPGTTHLVGQYPINILATGQFSIGQIAIGTFDIFIKINGYLQKSLANQTIDMNNQFSFGALTPGDLNSDNQVTVTDISILSGSFAKTPGQSGYNALADFNCDGNINVVDISILSGSFGLVGQQPPL